MQIIMHEIHEIYNIWQLKTLPIPTDKKPPWIQGPKVKTDVMCVQSAYSN